MATAESGVHRAFLKTRDDAESDELQSLFSSEAPRGTDPDLQWWQWKGKRDRIGRSLLELVAARGNVVALWPATDELRGSAFDETESGLRWMDYLAVARAFQ